MIVETARAKINLALHVRRRRDDGYHEIETLFAFVRDGDELRIAPAAVPSFAITGPFAAGLEDGHDNLVLRARDAFEEVFGRLPLLAITLDKRLPVASGIGGGSADAAAMIRLLARFTDISLADPRLMEIAGRLGSDVPACLLGVTAIGLGRGERLTPIESIGGMPCLLVNPGVAVRTADVFARWDGIDRGGWGQGDALKAARAGRNDLEPAARAIAPVIGELLDRLGAMQGASLVRMSGSGATCFALFDCVDDLAQAAATMRRSHPEWWCLETALA